MIVCSSSDKDVSKLLECLAKSMGVLLDLGNVFAKERGVGLTKSDGDGSDRVLMRTALNTGEDGVVDLLLERFAVKDETGSWASERLVGRCGDHVAVFKRVVALLRGDNATDVGHVAQQIRSVDISDLLNPRRRGGRLDPLFSFCVTNQRSRAQERGSRKRSKVRVGNKLF